MKSFNIFVKVYKKLPDDSFTIYFETHSRLVSCLLLYDVYTQTVSHYKELLTASTKSFILDVRVDSKKDYIHGHSKINF